MTTLNPVTNPDAQEALSKCYGNDVIILVPLKSGRWAIGNNARQLCGIVESSPEIEQIRKLWYAPATINILRELGLTE